jgi:hypothetical protein
MLWIITEFDNVPVAVIGFQQVGLCAPTHFPDVADSGERHRREFAVT